MSRSTPYRRRTIRRVAGPTVAAASVLIGVGTAGATTAPTDPAPAGSDAPAEGPTVIAVEVTADGCALPEPEYPAGALTFEVTNVDAVGVTEFEILDGDRIIAEKENLPPGFSGEFSVELGPGSYTVFCPGATTERSTVTLTGTATTVAPTDVAGLLQEGADSYLGYVQVQLDEMVLAVGDLRDAIAAGDLEAARLAYINARPFYERIEPVAESFVTGEVNLDVAIDLRADDVAPEDLTGFHRIEYALWAEESLDGLDPVAEQLVADVDALHVLIDELPGFQPAELANGAVGLLDEAAAGKITGEEERYSHIDLVDLAANVQGAEQAFAHLETGLSQIDPTLVETIKERFGTLDAVVAGLESDTDPSGYVLYDDLTPEQITELSNALQAVAEPLSQVAAKVVNA